MIKHKVHYQRSELSKFVDKLKELIREQQKEVEKAIIGRGKYQLKQQYQFLEISESKWFIMSSDQRKKHLSKLQSLSVNDSSHSEMCSELSLSKEDGSDFDMPVDASSAAEQLNIPQNCLEGIWNKAKQLIQTEGAIVSAPGQPPEARMVMSYGGKTPHMVVPKKGGDFSCDSTCCNWKSIGICSHSVAVATVNKQLEQFISAKKKKEEGS